MYWADSFINISMFKKILCIGCSLTYGEELKSPSQTSWPSLLGQINDWDVTNAGKYRSSNDRIMRVLFEELDNKYDLIIIAWSQTSRFEIMQNSNYRDVSLSCATIRKFKWAEEYYKYYYDLNDSYRKWINQIILLQSYLEKINQPYIFCNAFSDMSNLPKIDNIMALASKVDTRYYLGWMSESIMDWTKFTPHGPGYHPLEEGHVIIADKINNFIHTVYPN